MYKTFFILLITFINVCISCCNLDTSPNKDNTIEIKTNTESNENGNPDSLISISPTRNSFLFLGITNPVEIKSKYKNEELLLTCNNKGVKISKIGSGIFPIFLVKYNGKPRALRFNVLKANNQDTTFLYSQNIRVKKLPSGTPMISNKQDGDSISMERLKAIRKIEVPLVNHDISLKYNVEQFTICTYTPAGKVSNTSQTNKFSDSQKLQLNSLSKGDCFYVENIICKLPDNSMRRHNTMKIIVK